jgi:hypothetical protein
MVPWWAGYSYTDRACWGDGSGLARAVESGRAVLGCERRQRERSRRRYRQGARRMSAHALEVEIKQNPVPSIEAFRGQGRRYAV